MIPVPPMNRTRMKQLYQKADAEFGSGLLARGPLHEAGADLAECEAQVGRPRDGVFDPAKCVLHDISQRSSPRVGDRIGIVVQVVDGAAQTHLMGDFVKARTTVQV